MKFVRNILFILFAAFTFASTVGMGVFTHFCHEDGIEQFYVIPQTNCCEEKKQKELSCCDHDSQVLESDCCSDQVDYYQFDFESFENHSFFPFDFHSFREFPVFSHFAFELSVAVPCSNFANPPPQRWGRQLLIHHQVFRI